MKLSVVCTIALLVASAASGEEAGQVAMEDTPGCDEFVVETAGGYVLLEWYGGVTSVWEGDKVFGDLHSYGMKDIYIDGRGEMRVWIDDFMVGYSKASSYFEEACD